MIRVVSRIVNTGNVFPVPADFKERRRMPTNESGHHGRDGDDGSAGVPGDKEPPRNARRSRVEPSLEEFLELERKVEELKVSRFVCA